MHRALRRPLLLALAGLLAACSAPGPVSEPAGLGPTEARALVTRLLPERTRDKPGWAADIHAALSALELPSTTAHLCAVMAVTEQESGFQADPPVPGLAAIARQEIDRRADRAGVPALAVRAALALRSPDGRSYAERLDAVKTERELSLIFEDFIGMVPLGKTFLADSNPVRTGGPMQVSIAFAEAQVRRRRYPYELKDTVRHEVFTRRGGLYFGAAHLLDYRGPYEQMLHRFADFNAGRWASRNAGFQAALALASGLPVTPDGDLLPHGERKAPGETERAAYSLAGRLGLDEAAVRRDLERGDEPGFEQTALHQRVFAYAEKLERRTLPRAVLPRIELHSPKITRKLSTEWFARRVDERYRRCLGQVQALQAG
ncbi:MAG: DUF1615 domain-containing protein [Rubrivivax sp.]